MSPALIPLLRNAATVAIVRDFDPSPVADVIGPMPGAMLGGWIWPGALSGAGIFTAATVWFATGHGSSIALAVGNVLRFIYGIGMLM